MNKGPTYTFDEIKKLKSSKIIIKNISTNEWLSILPGYGGRLKELWLNNGEKNISVLKKVDSIDSQDRNDIFTNAKLSPFAGRIKDGQYIFNNTKYSLLKNYPEEENACHGFIYNKEFHVADKIVNSEKTLCKLEYLYENEDEGYPFSYSIEITYTLTESEGLICTTRIINNSKSTIPLSDGWHHYFDLGISINDLELKLDVSEIVKLDSRNIPTGYKEPYNEFMIPAKIGNTQFDSCFKIKSSNGKAGTTLISPDNNINLNIWQETGNNKYEYLVIYTPPGRRSIAVEPITSNINSFNSGEGLILLAPDEEYISSFGIYLKKT
jgi:aldose 1-epimerase